MKKSSFLLLLFITAASCSKQPQPIAPANTNAVAVATPTAQPTTIPTLSTLRSAIGKAPDHEFWTSQPLADRLKKLLGDKYSLFIETMQVTSAVSEERGVIYVTGNNKQSGNQGVLLVDDTANLINVRLRIAKTKKVSEFVEAGTAIKLPPALQTYLSMLAGEMPTVSSSDEPVTKSIKFQPGATSSVVKDSLQGFTTYDYQIKAAAGQTLDVTLSSKNRFLYFNVLKDQKSADALNAQPRPVEVTQWQGKLPSAGEYIVRVYLVRAEARRNKTPVQYSLTIELK